MKILVSGATGFVGNHVVRELIRQQHTVIATSANEKKARTFSWFPSVKYVPFDLNTLDAKANYFQLFGAPDIMIHLAWEGLPNYKDRFHLEANFPRHLNFLKTLISQGLNDLTVTGTCFEYGMQEGALHEDLPVFPANPYGMAKDKLRRELERVGEQFPFVFKWVRLFYMYGEGQNSKSLLSQLIEALARGEEQFNMSGGEQVRDFLPVEAVASFIIKIAFQARITGIINCGSGQPITVKQFVVDYLKSINRNISLNLGYYPYPDYEPMRFWADISKLKTITGHE